MRKLDIARALGWGSLVIGLTEIVATRSLKRAMGVKGHGGLIKAMGLREWLEGFTVLAGRRSPTVLRAGLWSRVAGDALDLALLGAAAKKTRRPIGLAIVTGMVLGVTALDVVTAFRKRRQVATPRSTESFVPAT